MTWLGGIGSRRHGVSPSGETPTIASAIAVALIALAALAPVPAVADFIEDVVHNPSTPANSLQWVYPNWTGVVVADYTIQECDDVICNWCTLGRFTGVTVFNAGTAGNEDLLAVLFRLSCAAATFTGTMTYAGVWTVDALTFPAWTWSGMANLGVDPCTTCGCNVGFSILADMAPSPTVDETIEMIPAHDPLGLMGGITDECGGAGPWVQQADPFPKTVTNVPKYRITAPASVFPGSPFMIFVTALDGSGNTKTDYAGTGSFTSTDPLARIQGMSMDAYNYTWVPGDNGVHTFFSVSLYALGEQAITVADTLAGSMTGLARITVTDGPRLILTGSPRLAIADSGTIVQFRVCWSNSGTDSVFSLLLTDAVPTHSVFVPEASADGLDCGNTFGLPLTVGYSTVATPTVPAPDSFADGNPVAGTRWLRWTVPVVGPVATGCGCFRAQVQ